MMSSLDKNFERLSDFKPREGMWQMDGRTDGQYKISHFRYYYI